MKEYMKIQCVRLKKYSDMSIRIHNLLKAFFLDPPDIFSVIYAFEIRNGTPEYYVYVQEVVAHFIQYLTI